MHSTIERVAHYQVFYELVGTTGICQYRRKQPYMYMAHYRTLAGWFFLAKLEATPTGQNFNLNSQVRMLIWVNNGQISLPKSLVSELFPNWSSDQIDVNRDTNYHKVMPGMCDTYLSRRSRNWIEQINYVSTYAEMKWCCFMPSLRILCRINWAKQTHGTIRWN